MAALEKERSQTMIRLGYCTLGKSLAMLCEGLSSDSPARMSSQHSEGEVESGDIDSPELSGQLA